MVLYGKWGGGTPLLARWTENWDCGYETNWWYVIKDTKFDIDTINSKKRYEIRKGVKYFDVRVINPENYVTEIADVYEAAFDSYSRNSRPDFDKDNFLLQHNNTTTYYAAFFRDSGRLCGIGILVQHHGRYNFVQQKVIPEYEKYGINAAIVYMMLMDKGDSIESCYICDGARNILHETKFQDYLIKYFGFRKAYCKLCIKYRNGVGLLISLLFPIRKILMKFNNNRVVHNIIGVLLMEEIRRSYNE